MEAEIVPASILKTAHRQNGSRYQMACFAKDSKQAFIILKSAIATCGWQLADQGLWGKAVLAHPRNMVGEVVLTVCFIKIDDGFEFELRAVEIKSVCFDFPRGKVNVKELVRPKIAVAGLECTALVHTLDHNSADNHAFNYWMIVAFERLYLPADDTLLFLFTRSSSTSLPHTMRLTPRRIFCSRRLSHIQIFGLVY